MVVSKLVLLGIVIASSDATQGVDQFGVITKDGQPCGGFGQKGCDFGVLTVIINNSGDGDAEGCVFRGTEIYDITGVREGTILPPEMPRHQEREIGQDVASFNVPERTDYTMKAGIDYPYLGEYSIKGKITCTKGNSLDISETISIKT